MHCGPSSIIAQQDTGAAEEGNALLEMALFVPLALLFLFVAIDAGATLLEQAAVRDAMRTALNNEIQNIKANERLLRANTQDMAPAIGVAEPELYIEEVAERLRTDILKSQSRFSTAVLGKTGVRVALVRIYINTQSGEADSTRPYEVLTNRILPEDGLQKASISSDSFPYLSMEDFIAAELKTKDVSQFVQFSGLSYRADQPEQSARRFAGSTLLLYTEVRTIASGINQGLTSSLLGRLYALQEQQLRPLRSQS